ncbi:MAG: hypothetical protein LBQ92_03720 [Propionibacteriaceae bacterium]|jgi:hypothetical protein|nr:hypothetical protein [Propionibacteriaceae bacterium]
MGNLLAVKNKVQQYLQDIFGSVTIDSDGDFTVRNGSARGFISVDQREEEDGPVFVRIWAQVLTNVVDSPELHKYVAYNAGSFIYGRLHLVERQDGGINLIMSHVLLGDYLDEAELGYAVTWLMDSADDLDEELQGKFGGTRFHES